MSNFNFPSCSGCLDLGVLRATLVKREEENRILNERIDVVLCSNSHRDDEAGMKSIATLENSSGMVVNIIGAEKPAEIVEE